MKLVMSLILGAVFLCGCQQHPQAQIITWSRELGPPPPRFSSPQFKTIDRSVQIFNQTILFSRQRWGPAFVQGGSRQLIVSDQGQPSYGQARFLGPPLDSALVSPERLALLELRKDSFVQSLKRKKSWVRKAQILSEPELVILTEESPPVVTYAVDLLRKGKNAVERFWFTPENELKKHQVVSLDFDSHALVYTLENRALLQDVLLRGLLDSAALETRALKVQSKAPVTLTPVKELLTFPNEDPRFDQVQAFYFIQKGLDFFVEHLGFTLPVAVEVQTAMGYPENTNTAFTYHNQIRLGHGDKVTYGPIARDPSIVLHELGHVLVEVVAHLPTQGEGGSLNEAFADFFAASALNSPRMAEGTYLPGLYKRTLEDRILLSHKNGGLYHDSQIVSGTLWELRKQVGAELTQKLALKSLAYLGPAENLSEFPVALRKAEDGLLNLKQQKIVSDLLKERQWPD